MEHPLSTYARKSGNLTLSPPYQKTMVNHDELTMVFGYDMVARLHHMDKKPCGSTIPKMQG